MLVKMIATMVNGEPRAELPNAKLGILQFGAMSGLGSTDNQKGARLVSVREANYIRANLNNASFEEVIGGMIKISGFEQVSVPGQDGFREDKQVWLCKLATVDELRSAGVNVAVPEDDLPLPF